ncbi:hypothetical protein CCM_03355 [Cordyceps militaris CM01]|uniref:Uncharacterized protein n=1 Tax=Cordyceps militaris (strain CM01) TaxID=983644 RepID=G3JAB5_CORMM|nr:uncharacterized protein CCM_03355 [Cordyceps militaris CM01]EGX95083.1 hypothetical protein CCM_03355 [Cordyceps militaris CM01]
MPVCYISIAVHDPLTQMTGDFCLRPVPTCALALAGEEASLHGRLSSFPLVKYGCTELDEAVLLGGLERGSVVGISADDVDGFGLLPPDGVAGYDTGDIGRLGASGVGHNTKATGIDIQEQKCRAGLDSVMLSVVFDIDGIWQTLSELLQPLVAATSSSPVIHHEGHIGSLERNRMIPTTEIQDSEDEDILQPAGHKTFDSREEPRASSHEDQGERSSPMCPPEIIVVTHFSTFLTSLFARREKAEAHKTLAYLKWQLRGLSRSCSMSPLILLVNSTTTEEASNRPRGSALDLSGSTRTHRSPEPTLHSIFASVRSLRPSRPSFGVVFSQFLDLHILCTDLSENHANLACRLERAAASTKCDHQCRSLAHIEVLKDNLGINSAHLRKQNREKRWAVLDVYGQKIVNPGDGLIREPQTTSEHVPSQKDT